MYEEFFIQLDQHMFTYISLLFLLRGLYQDHEIALSELIINNNSNKMSTNLSKTQVTIETG